MIKRKKYSKALRYIDEYWKHLTCYYPEDKQLHLALPHRYICPNISIFKNDQFYWDTYFVILGLVKSGKQDVAKGMIDNFCFLYDRFGIIPMRNRFYNLGTSQIPFLTSMALEVYQYKRDVEWLKKVMLVAEKEYRLYWTNPDLTEKHIMQNGLSRYCDHYITHLGSEHESGWDMTSRFGDRCLDFLPVDLNSCLYKYEKDLAAYYRTQKNSYKAKQFEVKAEGRKQLMQDLMWSERRKFFFDYNNTKKKRSDFLSVAGFYPLWSGIATQEQAKAICDLMLPVFEFDGGIVNTQRYKLSKDSKQHDFPNGWPNQQWIVIKGLLNYGFRDSAERIAMKWMDMNYDLFESTGQFWEKHDVVNLGVGISNPDRYPTQSGFAWTNAIFVRLAYEFGIIK